MITVTVSIVRRADGALMSSATGSIRESLEFAMKSFHKRLYDQDQMDKVVQALEDGCAEYDLKIQRA